MTDLTDKEVLQTQIRQVKEAVAAMENRNSGSPGIDPEELWSFMSQKMDENTPVHPRITGIFNGHVEIEQVRKTIKRLENDLSDLQRIQSSEQLYDPMEHEIEESDPDPFSSKDQTQDEDVEKNNPQQIRDKKQRPLSAYQNKD